MRKQPQQNEPPLRFAPEIEDALSGYASDRAPVVALESTVISHGLPFPDNLEVARGMIDALRSMGALPAVIAVARGEIVVGADDALLQELARAESVAKVNLSNMAAVLASGGLGATTVASTLWVARMAGLNVFVTGGIGGRHRPSKRTEHDVSSDLVALSRYKVVTVCAGVKSILDVVGTRETLETMGVPLIGYGCDTLPLFISPPGDVPVDQRCDAAGQVAAIARMHWRIGGGGLLVTAPCPAEASVEAAKMDAIMREIEEELPDEIARDGRMATPWILRQLDERTDGASREANIALLINNARVGGAIAREISEANKASDISTSRTPGF